MGKEKKEIGIEKLIELLDKFRRENKTKELFGEPGTLVPLTGKDFIELNRVMIISKEYEFIKWLVENDKIDLFSRNALFIYEDTENGEKQRPYSFYEEMLIRLAISDTPIEDLILYLK